VSHAKYLPIAAWLVRQRPDLFQPLGGAGVQDTQLFIKSVQGTVRQGKRPPTDLYLVGPGDADDYGLDGDASLTTAFSVGPGARRGRGTLCVCVRVRGGCCARATGRA
jgi:hypothetical protein